MDRFFVEKTTDQIVEIVGDKLPDKYFHKSVETLKEQNWVLKATVPSWEYMTGFLPIEACNSLRENIYANIALCSDINCHLFTEKVIVDYRMDDDRYHSEDWICGNDFFWMILQYIVDDYSKYDRDYKKTADQIDDLLFYKILSGSHKITNSDLVRKNTDRNLFANLDVKDAESLRTKLLENAVEKAATRMLSAERCQERKDEETIQNFALGMFEGMVDLICEVFSIDHTEAMKMISYQASIEENVRKILAHEETND